MRRVGRCHTDPVRAAHVLRLAMNVVNLSTPVGLLVAAAGRCRLRNGGDGLLVASGYRWRVPAAPAFTLGNVIVLRIDEAALARRPRLLAHEARHATQYACCLGVTMLPLYFLAAGWSWARVRDFSSHNIFERLAGLEDGGYPPAA
jgi:Domain of unknown function (DUF4157)